jgi:hypothetical protein
METRQTHASIHECADGFQMVPLQKRMAAAAIGVDDDGRRAIERRGVRRPAVGVNDGGEAARLVETRFEQQATSAMFVLAWSVTCHPGNENDFLVSGQGVDVQDHHRSQ